MKNYFFIHYTRKTHTHRQGFVLPFTILITALVLFITVGSMTLLSKQFYFSRLAKQSDVAYFAADDALSCTLSLDDAYIGQDGQGIFPSTTTIEGVSVSPMTYVNNVIAEVNALRLLQNPLATTITTNDIKCGQSSIFDTNPSTSAFSGDASPSYAYHYLNPTTRLSETELGVSTSFVMRMDLGLDLLDPLMIRHNYRCAKVTVNKTPSFRQVIAQGYSSCDNPNGAIERAVVNTTVSDLDLGGNFSSMYDFLVQDVCLDAQANVLSDKGPSDGACQSRRNLEAGEALSYHKHDQHGVDTSPAAAQGYQRSDSFPSANGKYIVQSLDFGVSGSSFGTKDVTQDGFNIYESRGDRASIVAKEDGYGSLEYFVSSTCSQSPYNVSRDNNDSWVIADTFLFTGGNTVSSTKTGSSPTYCPGSFDQSYTTWNMLPSFTYTSSESLKTLVSTHYSHATIETSDHKEVFYFTDEYGATRWERWERLDTPYHTDEVSRAASKDASGVCNNAPGILVDGLGSYGAWYRVDCREWTVIRPQDEGGADSPSSWTIPSFFQ